MRMPKQKRQAILAEMELSGFLSQTHISDRNTSRIRSLTGSPNSQVAALATEMLDVVEAAPTLKRKKGRRSVAVTDALCTEVFERWRAADVLADEDETGEQAVGGDSKWPEDVPF